MNSSDINSNSSSRNDTSSENRPAPVRQNSRYKIYDYLGPSASITFFLDKLLTVTAKILDESPQLITVTRSVLSNFFTVLCTVDIATGFHWAIYGDKKDWRSSAQTIFIIARRIHIFLKVMDSKFHVMPIIQNLPILELANHALRIGGGFLSLSQHYQERMKLDREECRNNFEVWKRHEADLNVIIENFPCSLPTEALCIKGCIERMFGDEVSRNFDPTRGAGNLESLRSIINRQVTLHRDQLSVIDSIDRSLINDVNRIALGVLGLASFCTGATLLSYSGWLVLSVGLYVRSFGLYRTIVSIYSPVPRLEANPIPYNQFRDDPNLLVA